MKGCFFIGHRDAPDTIYKQLINHIEKCITEYGVQSFVVGHYGNFDRLSARAVIAVKKYHPHIKLFLLLPYHPAERRVKMPAGFDGTYYPEGMETVPRRIAIVRANRYMVDHSDCLIVYAWHPASNAKNLLEYALQREKKGKIKVLSLV